MSIILPRPRPRPRPPRPRPPLFDIREADREHASRVEARRAARTHAGAHRRRRTSGYEGRSSKAGRARSPVCSFDPGLAARCALLLRSTPERKRGGGKLQTRRRAGGGAAVSTRGPAVREAHARLLVSGGCEGGGGGRVSQCDVSHRATAVLLADARTGLSSPTATAGDMMQPAGETASSSSTPVRPSPALTAGLRVGAGSSGRLPVERPVARFRAAASRPAPPTDPLARAQYFHARPMQQPWPDVPLARAGSGGGNNVAAGSNSVPRWVHTPEDDLPEQPQVQLTPNEVREEREHERSRRRLALRKKAVRSSAQWLSPDLAAARQRVEPGPTAPASSQRHAPRSPVVATCCRRPFAKRSTTRSHEPPARKRLHAIPRSGARRAAVGTRFLLLLFAIGQFLLSFQWHRFISS